MPKVTVLVPRIRGSKKYYQKGECDMPASDVKIIQDADKALGVERIKVAKRVKKNEAG
jgi:hypothetical protein